MTTAHPTTTGVLDIDAAAEQEWGPVWGAGGVPGPTPEHPEFPDMTPLWREANLRLIRSFDWLSRLDTRNNPTSLFPDWDADPTDPASYNFAATDTWVEAVHSAGAEVLFTFASSLPRNKLPALDNDLYGVVVEHIVRHYSQGWAGGPSKPVRMYEFGDQPDFGPLHFAGEPAEFYAMYEAFANAVKRVDEQLVVGGPSVGFALNRDAPYREGFLAFVRERGLPLEFFSFLHFTDATRDPADVRFVADEMRGLLDASGFADTKLMLSYWNYLAIPPNKAPSDEKAAFMAAAAIALQDTPLDYVMFFRADSGRDPHYDFVDAVGIYDGDGQPDERVTSLALTGRALTGRRLPATGGDESGFSVLASRDGDTVRVLISNFAAPESALEKREHDEFTFRVPLGENRLELSMRLVPQRDGLASAGIEVATVRVANLPFAGRTVAVTERALDGERSARSLDVPGSGTLELDVDVTAQSVVLLEISPA